MRVEAYLCFRVWPGGSSSGRSWGSSLWVSPCGNWRRAAFERASGARSDSAVNAGCISSVASLRPALPRGGQSSNVRAVRVWMHSRSGVPQDVHVVTGRTWGTTRFVLPWIRRGQLLPRTIPLEPNDGGDVQLNTVTIPEWPPQASHPKDLPRCWLLLVVETASGHTTRRFVRCTLIGDQCPVLW